jgi:predicted phage terminase large subunit-like protein
MKSLLVSVLWPAWEWGPAMLPAMRYLTTSYTEEFVKRDSRRMRDLVTSEWYQHLWGDQVRLVRTGESSFANDRTGFRQGVPFKSMTGGRGDRVIIDDPHSTETAESDADRATTIRIFRESVPTRVNDPERSAIIVVMQRIHHDDVSGQIQKLHLPYAHLMLPMEFEPERRCSTPIGFTDPRSQAGDLLFPERFTRAAVEAAKVPMGSYAVAGQFQQRPTPREGGLFKRHWFGEVSAVPAQVTRSRGWDIAATKKKGADWTAGVRVAMDSDGVFYIEDCIKAQASPLEVEQILKAAARTDPHPTAIRIPEDPGAAGVAFAQALIRACVGFDIKAKRATGDKETRAKPAAAQAEAGNVKLVRTGEADRDAWIEPFLGELTNFPGGSHDDQVDAFSEAFNDLVMPVIAGGAYLEIARRELAAKQEAANAPKPTTVSYAVGSAEWAAQMAAISS